MNEDALKEWLSKARTELSRAIANAVRDHVAALQAGGTTFYGYGLMTGDYDCLNFVTGATNGVADIAVAEDAPNFRYCKYSVDEWQHWEYDRFSQVNQLLTSLNQQFQAQHTRTRDDSQLDDYQILHADQSYDAIIAGLEMARAEGVFGSDKPFLVVWVSDTEPAVIMKSVRRLNEASVVDDFLKESW